MSDIVAFLTAQYDEDERIATAAAGRAAEWWDTGPGYPEAPEVSVVNDRDDFIAFETDQRSADHIARHDPARVLADVAAKRAIVADYQIALANNAIDDAVQPDEVRAAARSLIIKTLRMVLLHLALVYSDHPDYDESWRP